MNKKVMWLLDRLLDWCPFYKMAVGGYEYHKYTREWQVDPDAFQYFGKNAVIAVGASVHCPERCHIGTSAMIHANCFIQGVGGFYLGDHSVIAGGCTVLTTDDCVVDERDASHDGIGIMKPVWIEDYVWVGSAVCIFPGVRIGKGAIVGLGSIVREDVPPMAIVCGDPAEIVRYRDEDEFNRLEAMGRGREHSVQCTTLWIAPFMRRKYEDELAVLGIDASGGQEYFEYDKNAPVEQRLRPLPSPSQT